MDTRGRWYLRPEVYFEPLVNHWYAWPYLIPPAQAARYITNTHRRIMTSFVTNHALHVMAVKERGIAGGEFLDSKESDLPRIRALLEEMNSRCCGPIQLSEALTALDELLRAHTSGESLEPLYAHVPQPLKGFVELHLDLEHRASYRLIEPLLYRSSHYMPTLQSISLGLLSSERSRPFVLSTPRLPDEHHFHAEVAFESPRIDRLFRAREAPLSDTERDQLFADTPTAGGLAAAALFTTEPPRKRHTPPGAEVRLTYTGHAGFLLETSAVSVLIDPVIGTPDGTCDDQMVTYNELPPTVDYICLTHNHQDHVSLETLLQLRHKTKRILVPKNNGGTLADPSIRLLLQRLGFEVSELDELDEVALPAGRIVSVPFLGEHGDLHVRSKCAWTIELNGRRFFFGADSSNPDNHLYERLGRLLGPVDVLAIGMECVGAPYTWLYGALHSRPVSKAIRNSRRLNGSDFRQAFPMVRAFAARQVLIYALGREPWYKYFMGIEYDSDARQIAESNRTIDACREIGVPAEALYGRRTLIFSPAP